MLTNIRGVFFFIFLVTHAICSEAQINNNTFQRKIYVAANEIRVDSLLRIFTRQTGVEFSFSSNKISPAKKIAVANHAQTLNQWLNTLNRTLGVQHKVVGNHIILIDVDKPVSSKQISSASTKKALPPATKVSAPAIANVENARPQNDKQENGSAKSTTNANARVDSTQQKPPLTSSAVAPETAARVDSVSKKPAVPVSPVNSKAATAEVPAEKSKYSSISFVGGFGKHGSGDMKGIVFGGDYTVYYSRKFSLTYNFRGGVHSSIHPIHVDNGGNITDASIRFTTAGFQLGANAGLSVLNSAHHEVMIKLGAFGRYQSASNGSDGYSLYSPTTTGVPTVLVGYDNRTPQQTLAFGGVVQLQYNFTFNSNLFLGIQPAFQTDTNGDVILQASLVVGKRF